MATDREKYHGLYNSLRRNEEPDRELVQELMNELTIAAKRMFRGPAQERDDILQRTCVQLIEEIKYGEDEIISVFAAALRIMDNIVSDYQTTFTRVTRPVQYDEIGVKHRPKIFIKSISFDTSDPNQQRLHQEHPSAEEEAIRKEELKEIRKQADAYCESLTEKELLVVRTVVMDDKKPREAAVILGIPAPKISSTKQNALRKMRRRT